MRGAARTTVSAVLFAGFAVIAWLQVVVALAVDLVVLSLLPTTDALRVGIPLVLATAGLFGYGTVRALRLRRPSPAGVPVTRADAPALWTVLDEASTAFRVRPPDAVLVVASATAALVELGWRPGVRTLYVGLPLLQAWDGPRLRAALARELAEGSPLLGRFAPSAHRSRATAARLVARLSRRNPTGPFLLWYAALCRRLDGPAAADRELGADRLAAGFAGAAALAGALRDLPALEGLQAIFHAEYLGPGWQEGYAPDDVFGGLLRVLAARAEEIALLRRKDIPLLTDPRPTRSQPAAASEPTPTQPVTTSQPASTSQPAAAQPASVSQNATAQAVTPSEPATTSQSAVSTSSLAADSGTAAESEAARPEGEAAADAGDPSGWVPDLPALGRALQAVAFPPGDRTVVGWDEFFGIARHAEMQREADAALRAVSMAVGAPVNSAADLLDLVAEGRLRQAIAGNAPRSASPASPVPASRTPESASSESAASGSAPSESAASESAASQGSGPASVMPAGVAPGSGESENAAAESKEIDAREAEAQARVVDLITLLLALAALNGGVARWRHSWAGTAEMVALDGGHLDLIGPATLAADPATVAAAREHLAAIGIETASELVAAR